MVQHTPPRRTSFICIFIVFILASCGVFLGEWFANEKALGCPIQHPKHHKVLLVGKPTLNDTLKYCSSKCSNNNDNHISNSQNNLNLNGKMCNLHTPLTASCKNVQEYDLSSNVEAPGTMNYFVAKYLPCIDLYETSSWGRCAIVGNSGSLKRIPHGKEIDQHDTIIRFNNAPTEGYEDMVGSRTNYRIINDNWVTGRHGDLPIDMQEEDTHKLLRYRSSKAMFRYHETVTEHFFSTSTIIAEKFMNATRDCLTNTRNSLLEAGKLGNLPFLPHAPTSGFFSVVLASFMCTEISAFGFVSRMNDTYNYFGATAPFKEVKSSSHNFEVETAVMKYWDEQLEEFRVIP